MGCQVASQLEEMSPISQIHSHYNLGFGVGRQYATSLLRSSAVGQHDKVVGFGSQASGTPVVIEFIAYFTPTRTNNGDLATELIQTVVAVSCALLSETSDSMSNNLMRDTAIGDELHGNVLMNPPLGRSQLAYRDGDENIILDIQGDVVLILGEEEAVTTNDSLKISGRKTEGGDTSLSVVSPSSHITGDNMTDLTILIHVVGESQIRSEHLTTVLRQSVAM
jgi:hypothetical protein